MTDTHDKLTTVETHAPIERMHPMVQSAIAAGPDPQTLRELLAVQREWEKDEARRAYTRAMVALKQDLPTVLARDKTVDYTSKKTGARTLYSHTSLAAAVDNITEPLTRHGFSLSWEAKTDRDIVHVTAKLTHTEGHVEKMTISAAPDTSGQKSPPQAVASTMTLLQRYSALALLGIATKDQTEPQNVDATPDPTRVDAARNLTAVGAITKRGHSVDDAVAMIGKPAAEWTTADLDRIKAWLQAAKKKEEPKS
jgi:hypothetical protein